MCNNNQKISLCLMVFLLNFVTIPTIYAHPVIRPYYIFSGNANKTLAQTIAFQLRTPLANMVIDRYNDGEINIRINENIKNKEVFIIQSTCKGDNHTMNDSVMELYLIARELKRNGAKRITAIVPYLGYTQQDRKDSNFAPLAASDIAYLLEQTGLNTIITIDLHSPQIQGFFHNVSIENIQVSTIMVPYFANLTLKNPAIVSLHSNGMLRAESFKRDLLKIGINSELAMAIIKSSDNGITRETNIIGKIKGKDAIIIDDRCETGTSLIETARTLKQAGALNIYAAVTHPLLSANALENLANSGIKEIVITDSIPIKQKLPPNIRQLSVAPILAELIRSMNNEK